VDFKNLEIDDDGVEVSVSDFDDKTLIELRRGVLLRLFESEWPEMVISRSGKKIIIEFTEHIYSKYWWHKYHARFFCDAMVRAVRRMTSEGVPFQNPYLESDDDIHLFVRWTLVMNVSQTGREIIETARDVFNSVLERTNNILDDSDSVLILGKDTGPSMKKLKLIQKILDEQGFHCYIIKEEADRLGESVIQKVMRYALASRFVIVENSEPSGHLYEFPHVAKMAECIVVVLQEKGHGATWMFEDAYHHHKNWKKFQYNPGNMEKSLTLSIDWAKSYLHRFKKHQKTTLPWFKK
jgi:hypothetical protein